jgi:hypothetical protein
VVLAHAYLHGGIGLRARTWTERLGVDTETLERAAREFLSQLDSQVRSPPDMPTESFADARRVEAGEHLRKFGRAEVLVTGLQLARMANPSLEPLTDADAEKLCEEIEPIIRSAGLNQATILVADSLLRRLPLWMHGGPEADEATVVPRSLSVVARALIEADAFMHQPGSRNQPRPPEFWEQALEINANEFRTLVDQTRGHLANDQGIISVEPALASLRASVPSLRR